MKLTSSDVSVKYNENNEGIITINEGEFCGIAYKYGKVSIDTDSTTGEPCMTFGYNIVSETKPSDISNFRDAIAALLHEMILDQIGSGELQYSGGVGPSLDEINSMIAEARDERIAARVETEKPHNEATNLLANLGRQTGEFRGNPTETAPSFLDRLAAEGEAAMIREKRIVK